MRKGEYFMSYFNHVFFVKLLILGQLSVQELHTEAEKTNVYIPIILNTQENWKCELTNKIKANSIPKWFTEQISEDLQTSKNGITLKMLDETMNAAKSSLIVVRYQIKKNKLFIKDFSNNVFFYGTALNYPCYHIITRTFNALLEVAKLPDVEFIVCLNDFYQPINHYIKSAPLMAFAKNSLADTKVIAIPDFNNNKYQNLIDDSFILQEIILANKGFPWKKKNLKHFGGEQQRAVFIPDSITSPLLEYY